MGIYDREYYRGESGGPGWFGGVAPICKTIILINGVVFLLEHAFRIDPQFIAEWLAASPEGIFRQGRIWQLVTATFLHGGPMHILGNMLFLWIAGREMESLYGSRDFLAFYLTAGILSTLGWAAIDAFSPGHHVMLGASGAVMAVVVLYTLYYPRREILLFFVLPLPMWVLVVLYLFLPFVDRSVAPQVAIESHLIGAGFGVIYKFYDLRWSRLVSRRWFSRPRLKIFSPITYETPRSRSQSPSWSSSVGTSSGSSKPSSVMVLPEEQLDARLDEVLAKIAREGRDGLTEEEIRVLQEASRRARIKRSDRL
jgi:membrane associated rhomboid family serine protease